MFNILFITAVALIVDERPATGGGCGASRRAFRYKTSEADACTLVRFLPLTSANTDRGPNRRAVTWA